MLNYFVAGIAKTIETYPMRASGYYSTDSSLLAARYFYENYFQGFKVQVKGHPDAFISRIYNPRVVLNYQINKSDIQEEFIMSSAPLVAIDTNYAKNTTFTPKGTIFRHSANSSVLNGTSGILIQGGAGYQTLVDMSPIASWIDSTNMLINKAVVQFTVEDTVGAEPSSSLVLTMYDKLNQKTLFSFEKDYNETLGTYTFEIQEMLNTFINNGVPLKDNYQFTLSCPEPNTTVNKTRLSSKDGVKINIIYSKY